MANETQAAAPAKKRRAPQGPRTPKPIFAIVTLKDEQGQVLTLDRSRLSIQFERDSSKLVELLTDGGGINSSAVIRVELPAPAPRAKSGEAAA